MANPSPPPNETYTMLTQTHSADLDSIGAHCQSPFCHQLDFLPFRCDSCHSTFCLDHRSETAHNCPKAGEWARNRRRNEVGTVSTGVPAAHRPTVATGQQCSEVKCKTFVDGVGNVGVRCDGCNRLYCLKHRMSEGHDCKNVVPLGAKPSSTADANKEKLRLGLGKLRSWGSKQQGRFENMKPKAKQGSAAARMVEVNKLKRECKGDERVVVEKRVYLYVEAEKETVTAKVREGKLWASADWSVGRLLDDVAKRLQVANLNNQAKGEEDVLRVYHVEGGRILEFSEKVGKALVNGNTIVLLRGVGTSDS